MGFLYHILETFTEITGAIGWIFALAFCVSLIVLAFLLANSMQRLKKYGCSPGFAGKLKARIMGSSGLSEMLYSGKVSAVTADKEIMNVLPDKNKHLLYRGLLGRFITRAVKNIEKQPSLQSLSDEFAIISSIQRSVSAIRSVAALLPAVGLCGTLLGMFRAFTGTDFNDPDMQKVMTGLMMDFGTALWTTILAVIIKVWADIWCHFGPQRLVSIMTDELVQMKYHIFDILEQQTAETEFTDTLRTEEAETEETQVIEEQKKTKSDPGESNEDQRE